MRFKRPGARCLTWLVAVIFLLQVVGCGTMIYPERRGQQAGRIDVGIAVLDGLGLLLFLIPGVIAFAVDFSTGAIYLPGGKSRRAQDFQDGDLVVINVKPGKLNMAKLDEILVEHTGEELRLHSDKVQIYEAEPNGNIMEQLRTLSQ